MGLKLIEEALAEKYPHINTSDHIWNELINTSIQYGSGLNDLLIELMMKVEEIYKKNGVGTSEFKIEQIKEKYGQLRIYVSSSIDEVHHRISEYEVKANKICDECGAIGSLHVKDGWFQVLCVECAFKEGYKKV